MLPSVCRPDLSLNIILTDFVPHHPFCILFVSFLYSFCILFVSFVPHYPYCILCAPRFQNSLQTSFKLPTIQVHSGFLSSYDSVSDTIAFHVQEILKYANKGVEPWKLWITGHSLVCVQFLFFKRCVCVTFFKRFCALRAFVTWPCGDGLCAYCTVHALRELLVLLRCIERLQHVEMHALVCLCHTHTQHTLVFDSSVAPSF